MLDPISKTRVEVVRAEQLERTVDEVQALDHEIERTTSQC
jgi:hypothetical protein